MGERPVNVKYYFFSRPGESNYTFNSVLSELNVHGTSTDWFSFRSVSLRVRERVNRFPFDINRARYVGTVDRWFSTSDESSSPFGCLVSVNVCLHDCDMQLYCHCLLYNLRRFTKKHGKWCCALRDYRQAGTGFNVFKRWFTSTGITFECTRC